MTNIKISFIAIYSLIILAACSEPTSQKIVLGHDVFKGLDKKSELKHDMSEEFVTVEVDTKAEAEAIKEQAHRISHELGRCGGFTEDSPEDIKRFQKVIKRQNLSNQRARFERQSVPELKKIQASQEAFKSMSADNLKDTIEFLSGFDTRSSRSREPNAPIEAFKKYIEEKLSGYSEKFFIELVNHTKTKQKSIHVRIEGSKKPNEIVVLGGHVDSIGGWFSNVAPGADDNASGSAVVLETLKGFLASNIQPQRTIDFYWYAAEEQGLIGSKEIAENYANNASIEVVAVMQLDMVLYPGNGDVIGLTEDYTDVRATDFVEEIVTTHLGLETERYKCGYGCSDHASWYRNGFKTVYPFEATFGTHNRNIHTKRDVIDNRSSIDHAFYFTKIALSFLHEVSTSNIRF